MSDGQVYESYCAFCARVGVEPMDFDAWRVVRWTLALGHTS